MVQIFREVKRVLRNDGTLWLNMGDSYWSDTLSRKDPVESMWGNRPASDLTDGRENIPKNNVRGGLGERPKGLKPKDLCGIPWMLAFALRADGWYLRSDIIWCLSGGTIVYARTQKGDMPMTIKDMYRLDPSTVKLWNGDKWTQLRGISKSGRLGDEIEIVLRSGERISCTPGHKFPTNIGLLEAIQLNPGDILERTSLPGPDHRNRAEHITFELFWFIGLYIAEGSRSEDTIQIAGHVKEDVRWERVKMIAESYGGSVTRTISGNKMDIRVYSRILNAFIDEFVSGKTAKDKGFSAKVWQYSNFHIQNLMLGYLQGDGHEDKPNNRWRLGFTRNYKLEQDLRTACARLGWRINLKFSTSDCNGKKFPSLRGEIRFELPGHGNVKDSSEVVEIRKARARQFYDIGVEDEPHLFALASGILTHNSKPNPMPESVTDRPTKSHEYMFLLSKSHKYFYDADAIKEPQSDSSLKRYEYGFNTLDMETSGERKNTNETVSPNPSDRNKRTVWTIPTSPMPEAHFATFPKKLIEPCVLAGSPKGGTVLDPFFGSGTTGLVAYRHGRKFVGIELSQTYLDDIAIPRIERERKQLKLF